MSTSAQSTVTVVDWYRRTGGTPVIRIDVQEKEFLDRLASVFGKLAGGELYEYVLRPSGTVLFTSQIKSFEMRRKDVTSAKSLTVMRIESDAIQVLWETSTDGWQRYLELLNGVLESPVPCHQYFGNLPPDDADLEIAFREWRPNLSGLRSGG